MGKRKENSRRKRIDNNSSQQELEFRIIAENTYDFEFWINPEGRYIYASPACKRIAGYKPEDFFKDPSLRRRMVHPDDLAILKQHIQQKEKKHRISETEYRIFHKNGSVRWISHACRPVFSDNGEYLGLRGSNRDITARKKAEEEIIHLASFPELNPRPICEVDVKGNIGYMNPALKRLFPGIARAGIRHPWFTDFKTKVMPEFRNRIKNIVTRELVVGKHHFIQDITYIPERGCVRIYGQDITERKQAEEALKHERNNLQMIFDAVSVGMLLVDSSGNVKRVNSVIADWIGKGLGKVGKTQPGDILQCIHALKDKAGCGKTGYCAHCSIRNTLKSVLHTGDSVHDIETELYFLLRGAETRLWVSVSADPLVIDGARHAILIISDITSHKQAEKSLRESQEDLNRAQSVTLTGSWRLDVNKNELTWSDENHHIFGIPKGTHMTYETFLDKVHPDDRRYVNEKWTAGLRGEPYDIEHRIIVDGKIKWVREKAALELDKQGKLLGGFGITQDVSELKKAEAALRKSKDALQKLNSELELRVKERTVQLSAERQRLYTVLETLPVYVVLLTPDYHVSFANKFFRERFGEDHGRRCFEYLFKRKEPCENCETYKVLQNKLPHHWEWLGPDGCNYDIYDFPFTETDGSTHIMEMGIDITERKRAEKELRRVSLYVRNLIEASLDPLVTINAEGKITDVNSATELVTGYSRNELIGTDFCDYFTEPQKARSGYQHVFKEGLVRDYPLEICHRNGHTTPVLYNATVYRNEKGDVVGIFAAARDVSERKKAEKALLEAEKEVERAKRLTGIGMLASTVAHELRNPLAAIKMAGYNIKRKAKDPALETHLLNIETKLTESEQIISNLLFYSKIRMPHLGKINLYNILNACIIEATERFSKYSIAIEKNTQPIKNLLIEADPLQIKEVFSNILNNAFDAFLEHTGRIKIEATADDKTVKVSIKDTGVGIAKEDLERLFEPFFTTKAKGTGLGLAICQQITHLHGGSIHIESEKNKGTTVTVTLPINQKKNA